LLKAIVTLVTDEKSLETEITQHRNWKSPSRPGLYGRFVPDSEMPDFEANLSTAAHMYFEQWLREISSVTVDTEINVQLGEFTLKRHQIEPLDPAIMKLPDFQDVLGKIVKEDIIQCAEVKNTTNRKWLRLVGLRHDIQLWVKDTRQPTHYQQRPYDTALRTGELWIRDIVELWKYHALANIQLFLNADEDYSTANDVLMYGYFEEKGGKRTLKEVMIGRYPPILQVFNVVEFGRRFYRTQIFSSNPAFSYHEMDSEGLMMDGKFRVCAGSSKTPVHGTPTLVITRNISRVLGVQTYMPARLLYGLIPHALIEQYEFWQNEDDSLFGYLRNENSLTRSFLVVKVNKYSAPDVTGNGLSHATAVIQRIILLDTTATNKINAQLDTTPDPNKPVLTLLNLAAILQAYVSEPGPVDEAELCSFEDEAYTFHALVRLLLRLETFGNILVWSESDPSTTGVCNIDMIELPMLKLTFERHVVSGIARYYCLEHSGLFISNYSPQQKIETLLDGLPHAILLENANTEDLFILLASIAKPFMIRHKDTSFLYEIALNRSDPQWRRNSAQSPYFLYRVHVSGCFMFSKTFGSTMYLLLYRLMLRKYHDAFKLIDACVSDSVLSAQEQQIFDCLAKISDDFYPDGHACKLKFFLITHGCAKTMPFPWDLSAEMDSYVEKSALVSAAVRLKPHEEVFVFDRCTDKSIRMVR
jgi:hypothetical protein